MIFVKKHATEQGPIVAMCDEELLGKVLKQGKLLIDLEKYAEFYKGDLLSEEEAWGHVREDEIYSANVVGERSVAIMVRKGIVQKDEIKKVGKVPFVQVYNVAIF
jgi:hypothetical protein